MSEQKITIAFQTDKPLSAYGALAAAAEKYGFDGVTVYNDLLYQPPWLPLLEMAKATHRVQIGIAAVVPFLCHPVNIAGNIALLDEASNGRAFLGMARGGWLEFVGVEAKRPVVALSEAFACVRHLLRQSTAPLTGEIFPLAGGDSLRWKVLRPDIPFLLGSWGEKTIRACADRVDEVKIGGSANPDVIAHFRRMVGNERVKLVIGAVTVVDEDRNAALARARREVALYLPVVADLDPTVEVEPELLAKLRLAAERYDFAAAGQLISNELLAKFAFAGNPGDLVAHAQSLFDAGVDRVEFGTPHGLTPEEGLRLLGEKVLPALRG